MRVLITTDAVGGVWTYATDLATGLSDAGVEVHLAVLGPQPSVDADTRRSGAQVQRHALAEVALDWLAPTPEAVREGGEALAALAQRLSVDLVHLNSPALAADARFSMPVLGVCHSDVATWWAAVKGGPLPTDLAWRAELTRRGYAACDALLAPSAAFAAATAAAFELDVAPAVVLNGRASAAPEACAGIVVDSPDAPFVFTCGRLWDEGKNVAVLDRAAGHLNAPAFAAGPVRGPNGASVALAHAVPLGVLPAAEVARWNAAAAVFVSMALYEPFGLAVLEAAQAARPLVLSDIATFRELWDGAALFVRPGDDDALAAALGGLIADAGARDRLGQAARRRAERYTLAATVDGVLTAYHSVLPPAHAEAAA